MKCLFYQLFYLPLYVLFLPVLTTHSSLVCDDDNDDNNDNNDTGVDVEFDNCKKKDPSQKVLGVIRVIRTT